MIDLTLIILFIIWLICYIISCLIALALEYIRTGDIIYNNVLETKIMLLFVLWPVMWIIMIVELIIEYIKREESNG